MFKVLDLIFHREPEITQAQWAELCRFQQQTALAVAHVALRIATHPELATSETQDELRDFVSELEDRLACLDEHIV